MMYHSAAPSYSHDEYTSLESKRTGEAKLYSLVKSDEVMQCSVLG